MKIQDLRKRLVLIFFTGIPVMACLAAWPAWAGEVNIYSHRHYESDERLYERFTEKTGIEVNVVQAGADQLIQRLKAEGDQSPADILITVDAGRLHRAEAAGLLQPVESEVLNKNIPAHLRDPKGYWFGLTIRTRVMVYAKDRVDPDELSTYEALAEEKWRNRVLIRSSENIYNQSLLASLIAHHGREEAKAWAEGIRANMARPPRGGDRDQIRGVASGIGDVAIVNHYYLGLLRSSDDPEELEAGRAVEIFFPNQNGRGAHVNISGAGVTQSAPNKENAIKLLEFLSSRESQRHFAKATHEFPIKREYTESELLKPWSDFKSDKLNLSKLGEFNREAVMIFDEVGWQ
jgi:iron(III) transport system substrate-binding protein